MPLQRALSRKGELIFCEGKDGDYLPFRPLVELKGVAGKVNKEVIFYKSDFIEDNYDLFGEINAEYKYSLRI